MIPYRKRPFSSSYAQIYSLWEVLRVESVSHEQHGCLRSRIDPTPFSSRKKTKNIMFSTLKYSLFYGRRGPLRLQSGRYLVWRTHQTLGRDGTRSVSPQVTWAGASSFQAPGTPRNWRDSRHFSRKRAPCALVVQNDWYWRIIEWVPMSGINGTLTTFLWSPPPPPWSTGGHLGTSRDVVAKPQQT